MPESPAPHEDARPTMQLSKAAQQRLLVSDDLPPTRALNDSAVVREGAVQLVYLVELAIQVSAAQDLDQLLQRISEGLIDLLGAERATIYVYDPATRELWSKATNRLEITEIRIPVSMGLAGFVARERRLVNVPDVSCDPRFHAEIDARTGFATRSMLAAPLVSLDGELMGVLAVLNKRRGAFDAIDEDLVRLFSGYAAVALRNALLREELVRRERFAALGAFAGTVIHDMRNMMNLVRGHSELIDSPDEETQESLRVITEEIDSMAELSEEVLEYTCGEDLQLDRRPLDVDAMLAEFLPALRGPFEVRGIALELEAGGAGHARIDPRRFRRIAINLADNARKVLLRGDRLVIRSAREGDQVLIAFEDTGPGVPRELVGRLFDNFVCGGEAQGVGLGLSICRSLVQAHEGTISARDVRAEAPFGTIIEIRLPGS